MTAVRAAGAALALAALLATPSTPASARQGATATWPDVAVSDPTWDIHPGFTQSTSAVVLGAGGTLLAAFTDTGGDGMLDGYTGTARSLDGGATWTDRRPLQGPYAGRQFDGGRPVFARSTATGTILLATSRVPASGPLVYRSTDNGASWGRLFDGGTDVVARHWLAVDNASGAGQGTAYLVTEGYAGGTVAVRRSDDDGQSFGGALTIAAAGHAPFVAVGPDHAVHVLYYDPTSVPRSLRLRTSTDRGVSFAPAVTVATLTGTGDYGALGITEFRTDTAPQAAVHPVTGHVYVVYSDDPAGGDRGDVYLVRSTTGGTTWDTPTRANTDGGTNDQFMPTLSLTPGGTRLLVSWYDRREDPANRRIARYGRIAALDAGSPAFGADFRISDTTFIPVVGKDPVVDSRYMGEYDQAAADDTYFYVAWGDNRLGTPDVRFARVPVDGPGPLLTVAAAPALLDTAACGDVALTVRNHGATTAVDVRVEVYPYTPFVSAGNRAQAYGDIPPGGAAANPAPFRIGIDRAFTCGSDVLLQVRVLAGGVEMLRRDVPLATSATRGTPATGSVPAAVPVPPFQQVEVPVEMAGFAGSIGAVTASLRVTHPQVRDLELSLVAPDGLTLPLMLRRGFAAAQIGQGCTPGEVATFDDLAATAIEDAAAPFAGTFRPESRLAVLNGRPAELANGTWKLRIRNRSTTGTASLACFTLAVAPAACVAQGFCGVPTTGPEWYPAVLDTTLAVPAPGVLANDRWALTAELVSAPAHGTLTLGSDGGFAYRPAPGFMGLDGFTYRAVNGFGPGDAVAVSVWVTSPPLTVTDDAYATPYRSRLTVPAPGVLANDGPLPPGARLVVLAQDADGPIDLRQDGSFTYMPRPCRVATDKFTYAIRDSYGVDWPADVTIEVGLPDPDTLQPPSDLRVVDVAGSTATVRFQAPCFGPPADGYVLKGGVLPGQVLGALPLPGLAEAARLALPNGQFYVRLHSVRGGQESGPSGEIPVAIGVPVRPSAPADLQGVAAGSGLSLSWRHTFTGGAAAGAVLDVSGPVTASLPLGASETFSHPSVPPGSYSFRVRSTNAAGASGASEPVALTFPASCRSPYPPVRVYAWAVGRQLNLVWDPPVSDAASSYVIKVTGAFTGAVPFVGRSISATVGPGTYDISVAAVNACGTSAFTTPVRVAIP